MYPKRTKNKQKVDKTNGITLIFVTEGDLDKIRDKIQEVMEESWNKLEDCYDTLLIGVKECIAELNILA